MERRDKKAFLSDQYKEIEENNRMGKTIEISKKKQDQELTVAPIMNSLLQNSDLN